MATGFDRDVWEGRKPMVKPAEPRYIEIGDVVWEKVPEDTTYDVRGGMVVGSRVNDDGERVFRVVDQKKRGGAYTIVSFELAASNIDPALVESRSIRRFHRLAREICKALGERTGAHIEGHDRWLLEVAGGVVVLADEMVAEEAAQRRGDVA